MLRHKVIQDLRDNPNGDPLTVAEAAAALEMSPARVRSLALIGALGGLIENGGTVTNIARESVRRQLGIQ